MQETINFDVGRAMLEDYLDGYPARLDIADALPLNQALMTGVIVPDARLLTFEQDGLLYALPTSLVLAYNVIQGRTKADQPWMLTFCNACNTGMLFNPVVDGQLLHFRRRGAYDGLLLIWDEETNSYWQHITGRSMHGSSRGKQLQTITTTRQMSALEAGALHSNALLLTSTLSPAQEKLSYAMEKMRANPDRVEERIVSTIGHEDTRRPRFELGLGVWAHGISSFYPLVLLHTVNNALITNFDGRPLLIYQTPEAISPVAAFVETTHAAWEGSVLRLDHGATIHNDMLYTPDKHGQPLETPQQLLMRWYGFALTFPDCAVATV